MVGRTIGSVVRASREGDIWGAGASLLCGRCWMLGNNTGEDRAVREQTTRDRYTAGKRDASQSFQRGIELEEGRPVEQQRV